MSTNVGPAVVGKSTSEHDGMMPMAALGGMMGEMLATAFVMFFSFLEPIKLPPGLPIEPNIKRVEYLLTLKACCCQLPLAIF